MTQQNAEHPLKYVQTRMARGANAVYACRPPEGNGIPDPGGYT